MPHLPTHSKHSPLLVDVAIIGSGLAGLVAALEIARTRSVAVLCKGELAQGASSQAQGGIAAVLDPDDSISDHVGDTLAAGAGLTDEAAARYIIERGPESIAWLISQGVVFTSDEETRSGLHLTREGGHSKRRIAHAADTTGRAIMEVLAAKVTDHPNITVLEHHFAIDLITSLEPGATANTCVGLQALDLRAGHKRTILAPNTMLATGGAGHVYLHTTNPGSASGDGVAMAWRAGCRVANMEFVQFHPTALYNPGGDTFLISEAIRGEGGLLRRVHDGVRFMTTYDPAAELATRDVVARAIDQEMQKWGAEYVHLDIRHRPETYLRSHFPEIFNRCQEIGLDITRHQIPVVPAAHYTCGGVLTDLSGQTDLSGLFALGETACTGLHGANRLASNSLLECIVTARAAAIEVTRKPSDTVSDVLLSHIVYSNPEAPTATNDVDLSASSINGTEDRLRRLMSTHVGIIRSTRRLQHARTEISKMREPLRTVWKTPPLDKDVLILRNLIDVADLITTSALERRESRGVHFNLDFSDTGCASTATILHQQ
ncbi:L-aspartate oxidase [Burkholderia stagnalis]